MAKEQLTAGDAHAVVNFDQRLKLSPNPNIFEPGHANEMDLLAQEIIAISVRVGLAGDELLAAAEEIISNQQKTVSS